MIKIKLLNYQGVLGLLESQHFRRLRQIKFKASLGDREILYQNKQKKKVVDKRNINSKIK